MAATYCEVALPVPLRSLFTYAIPERLAGSIFVGGRVVVPFRHRAMTGVVVDVSNRRPDPERVKNVKEIVEALDPIPALPTKLIELGRWVAGYYVAPPGEVFRAMLPPQVDLRHERELVLNDAGRARRDELDGAGNRSEAEIRNSRCFLSCASKTSQSAPTACASCRAEKPRRSAYYEGISLKPARLLCTVMHACRRLWRGTQPKIRNRLAKRKRAFIACSPRSAAPCRCLRSQNYPRSRAR